MKTILVIGASGLVGSRAVELAAGKYRVFGTFNTHALEGDNFFQLDVLDRPAVFSLVEKVKPDLVFDTHALHNVDYCETHPEEAWASNVDGTRHAGEAAKRAGAKYVFISTDYVFDGTKLGYTEKDKPNPLSYYARTKLAAEYMLEALGINHAVLRTSVVYGKGGSGKLSFALWLADKLRKGEKVNIVADQHNNPTFADNLVLMAFRLFEVDGKGTFHATGRDCMSRFEFAQLVARVFGLDGTLISPITTPQLNQIAHRPEKVDMSTSKIERVTGLKTLTAEEGLQQLKAQLGG